MNLGNIILPQLSKRSKPLTGHLKKGLVNSTSMQSLKPQRLSDIIAQFEQLTHNHPQFDEPLKMLKSSIERIKLQQLNEAQVLYLKSRVLKAEEKANQLRGKLKKLEAKYVRDISEIVKMKILSESTSMNKGTMLLSCNPVEMARKINEVIERQTFTFALTQTQQTPTITSNIGNMYFGQKQNLKETKPNHQEQIKALQEKIAKLESELYCTNKPSPFQQKLKDGDAVVERKHGSVLSSRTQSVSVPGSAQYLQSQQQYLQRLQIIVKQHERLKELCDSYKQQCLRKQLEQVFREKAILQTELQYI